MTRTTKRRRRKNLTYKILSIIGTIILVLLFIWIAFSIVEVWMHNATLSFAQPYVYSNFNLFEIMFKLFG